MLCREFAARQPGWTPGDVYPDYAVSGSSVHGRFAFERLVADARRGEINIILAEDIDRLSRNQSDIAGFYERMTFAGVEVWTVADGRISEMHIGLKGTMSAMFLRNLALKTHRGLSGRVREGSFAGGRCFGYKLAGTGQREIAEEEAAVVQRIFAMAADGRNSREISARLNAEHVPGPRGGAWNQSTLQGSQSRANGILRNELYVGRLVWNRQRFLRDPDTGKRVSRPNGEAARQIVEVPHLRIVDEVTWQAVQDQLAGRRVAQRAHRRTPKHLFSGLIRCGACDGNFIVTGSARGIHRFGCATATAKSTCTNRRSISSKVLEDRVLTALETHLLHEDVIAEAVKAYTAERKRLRATRQDTVRRVEKRVAEIDAELRRAVDLVIKGFATDALGARMQDLEAEKLRLKGEAKREPGDVVEFHPAIAERYRQMIRDLRKTMAEATEDSKREAVGMVRALTSKLVVYPKDDPENRDIELHGQLAAILEIQNGRKLVGRVVAGARFELATFRL
ncbi:recombinase family protein [Aureimonas pseudogalii]|uniref:recombinase family protein n=1 Tax=Aureimonas pseudogalii TaxID=1744844 RepID=UPI0035E45F18